MAKALYQIKLSKLKRHFVTCRTCGRLLPPGTPFTFCLGCGQFFCTDCIRDFSFEDHLCEDK